MEDLDWAEVDGARCDRCGASAFDALHFCHLETIDARSSLALPAISPEEAIERFRSGDLNHECPKAEAVRRRSPTGSCGCRPSQCSHRYIQIGSSEDDILWERCGKFHCPFCGPRAAEEFEVALRLSKPTHHVEVWGEHGQFTSVRKRINHAISHMKEPVPLQAAWYIVADGPAGLGLQFWFHSWKGPVTDEAIMRGLHRYFPTTSVTIQDLDWSREQHRVLPDSMVPAPTSNAAATEVMRDHLAVNGGRLIVHTTERYWRYETWRLTREEARMKARGFLDARSRGLFEWGRGH